MSRGGGALTTGQCKAAKKAFLAALTQTGNVSASAHAAGIVRQTAHNWRQADPEFAAAYVDAELAATSLLEGEAWRRAVQGTRRLRFGQNGKALIDPRTRKPYEELEYSDTLLIFLLKARDPQKYVQRQLVGVYDATREARKLAEELGVSVEDVMREVGLLAAGVDDTEQDTPPS